MARTFATLDHVSGGRAAWNVVTSVNDSEAQNYGFKQAIPHDARYDRADEFLEATTGLWDTWEDDALVLDRETPLFADPSKVHELNYDGEWFDVRGPLTVPRGPQGRPVLMQAGSSGRGREFAARWAELIFTGDPDIEIARSHYKDQKEKIGEGGRNPDTVRMCPMVYTVVGGVQGPRRGARAALSQRPGRPHGLAHAALRADELRLLGPSLDAPITDELIESVSGIRGLVQNIKKHIGGDTVTLGDLAGHRATLLQGPRFVGTGPDIADQMEAWFDSGACDGFVIAATHSPGAYEDVVRLVVPELQRRGVFRKEYSGTTLREHLGLERPGGRPWRLTWPIDRCMASASSTPPRWRPGPWWPPCWRSSGPR